jgi:hypothetical protein
LTRKHHSRLATIDSLAWTALATEGATYSAHYAIH